MNVLKACLSALLLVALGSLVTGCVSSNQAGSSIPWSNPASWENQVPGMGGSNMGR
jgi:hypothetical protein